MQNLVMLVGYCGQDPEIGKARDGSPYAVLSVATSRRVKRGDKVDQITEWNRVVVWAEGLVGVTKEHVRKGSLVAIEGTLQTRKWDDGGVERSVTEILVLPFRGRLVLTGGGKSGRPPAPESGAEEEDWMPEYA